MYYNRGTLKKGVRKMYSIIIDSFSDAMKEHLFKMYGVSNVNDLAVVIDKEVLEKYLKIHIENLAHDKKYNNK